MKIVLRFALLVAVSLMFNRETFAQVNSSYDSGTNFAKYVTYSFLGWQKMSNEAISLERQRDILQSLEDEFDKRGVTLLANNGSAVIALYVVIDEKTATADYADHLKEYGYGAEWGWGQNPESDTVAADLSEIHYKQGTLVVNMHDAGSRKLVWQAVVTDVIQKDEKKRAEAIPKLIAELMSAYPVKSR